MQSHSDLAPSFGCMVPAPTTDDVFHPGLARAWMQQDAHARFLHLCAERVVPVDVLAGPVLHQGIEMTAENHNLVDVVPLLEIWGADAVRIALAYLAPASRAFEWDLRYVEAASRWLVRLESLVNQLAPDSGKVPELVDPGERERDFRRGAWQAVMFADRGYRGLTDLNGAVSAVMSLVTHIVKSHANSPESQHVHIEALSLAIRLLSPVAPHTSATLWRALTGSAFTGARWPALDAPVLAPGRVEIAVQVDGKVRGRIYVEPGEPEESIRQQAIIVNNVDGYLAGRQVRKIVFIPDKLINFVAT